MEARLTVTVLEGVDPPRLPGRIEAQFNPAELTLEKSAQIGEQSIPGLDSGLLQFVRGQTQKLTVELTLDQASAPAGQPGQGVEQRMEALYQLVKVQPRTHAAPRVQVTWGPGLSMKAIAESVTRRLTLFDRQGHVLRAVVTVVFREYRTLEEQLQELNLQSADQLKVTVLRAGDRLDVLAAREYGDPGAWRALAAANGLEDPRDAVPGMQLRIPPRDALELRGRL
ncbi:MAG TPA: LysM peptidoglycan-binding domain-containing protein [Longimicrobium sp.]|nr:LysM peptidoglycan-binding domain-containing protein [Longimicrobium sp.]